MDKPTLKVEIRKVLGRKVKALRRDGILPANIYGKNVKSLAVELPVKDFLKVFEKTGETGLLNVQVDGQVKPVLVSNVQYHPVTDFPLHADFRQVDLKEKITAPVPIEIIGEASAERTGIGIMVQQMAEVEVEALPTDLPEKIVVDVSKLENVDDAVHVKDLDVDREKVALQAEEDQIVVKIEPPAVEEVAPPTEEEVPEEGAEAPAAEGEAAPEGEAPAEGPEEKKEE